jgi:hypothetical protein
MQGGGKLLEVVDGRHQTLHGVESRSPRLRTGVEKPSGFAGVAFNIGGFR